MQGCACVKHKLLIFFFWRKSRVGGEKTEKCMIRDLHFFCDATYTKKKKLRDLRFFGYATYGKKKKK